VNTTSVRGSDGNNGLHSAATAGDTRVLELLGKGQSEAMLNQKNKDGATPVKLAVLHNHIDCVEVLVGLKADLNMSGGGRLPAMAPLHDAIFTGSSKTVDALLQYKADPSNRAYYSRSPLALAMYAQIAPSERRLIVDKLLTAKANIDSRDLDGATALALAVSLNDNELVNTFLRNGAKVSVPDNRGRSIAERSVQCRNMSILRQLIQADQEAIASVDLLPAMISNDFLEALDIMPQPSGVLLMSDGISSCAFRKDSMLWYACYFEKRQLAAELFRKGDAVMEDDDSSDSSLLHALVEWGSKTHSALIKDALEGGANPYLRREDGNSALDIAVNIGNAEAIEALLVDILPTEEDLVRYHATRRHGVAVLSAHGFYGNAAFTSPGLDGGYEEACAWCAHTGLQWSDPSFKPCLLSLTGTTNAHAMDPRFLNIYWKRISLDITPGDHAVTGQYGSALFAATVPYADKMAELVIHNSSSDGFLEVLVHVGGQDVPVVVDNFIPHVAGTPAFIGSTKGKGWAAIYMKACAKVTGSYAALLHQLDAGVLPPQLAVATSAESVTHDTQVAQVGGLLAGVVGSLPRASLKECASEAVHMDPLPTTGVQATAAHSLTCKVSSCKTVLATVPPVVKMKPSQGMGMRAECYVKGASRVSLMLLVDDSVHEASSVGPVGWEIISNVATNGEQATLEAFLNPADSAQFMLTASADCVSGPVRAKWSLQTELKLESELCECIF